VEKQVRTEGFQILKLRHSPSSPGEEEVLEMAVKTACYLAERNVAKPSSTAKLRRRRKKG